MPWYSFTTGLRAVDTSVCAAKATGVATRARSNVKRSSDEFMWDVMEQPPESRKEFSPRTGLCPH